jgi:hypothetical protein
MNCSNPFWQRQRALQPAIHIGRHAACAIVLAAVVLVPGVASADPPPPNCGAHTDTLECVLDASPPTAAEQRFVATVGSRFPNVSSTQLVQYARQTCVMLRNGSSAGYAVRDLASHLGTTPQAADQVMDGAMAADCPGLTIGPDGAAR